MQAGKYIAYLCDTGVRPGWLVLGERREEPEEEMMIKLFIER